MAQQTDLVQHVTTRRRQGNTLAIGDSVYYEILRGLLWRGATVKLRYFRQTIMPLFERLSLVDTDWEQAAQFWAEARRKGKQLGDPDLLLAALAMRYNAVLVSSDADFDTLPVQREDWRV